MVTQKAKREIESGKRTEEQSKREKLKSLWRRRITFKELSNEKKQKTHELHTTNMIK